MIISMMFGAYVVVFSMICKIWSSNQQLFECRGLIYSFDLFCHDILTVSYLVLHVSWQQFRRFHVVWQLTGLTTTQGGILLTRGITRVTVFVLRDPSVHKRPIHHLSWSPDGGTRLAVTHCNLEFQRAPPDLSTHSYIWQVGKPSTCLTLLL